MLDQDNLLFSHSCHVWFVYLYGFLVLCIWSFRSGGCSIGCRHEMRKYFRLLQQELQSFSSGIVILENGRSIRRGWLVLQKIRIIELVSKFYYPYSGYRFKTLCHHLNEASVTNILQIVGGANLFIYLRAQTQIITELSHNRKKKGSKQYHSLNYRTFVDIQWFSRLLFTSHCFVKVPESGLLFTNQQAAIRYSIRLAMHYLCLLRTYCLPPTKVPKCQFGSWLLNVEVVEWNE